MSLRNLALISSSLWMGLVINACLPDETAPTSSPNPAGSDGGSATDSAPDVPSAPGQAKQTGYIIDLNTKARVEGVTIDLGGKTGITDSDGKYSIAVPHDIPFSMTVTGEGHLKLIDQEWKLTGDFDRKDTSVVPTSTSDLLRGSLPGYDATKATISVGLTKTAACATEGGATIELVAPGAADASAIPKKYFRGGFPSGDTVSVDGSHTPTAVFWNLEPNEYYTVKVTHPTCTVAPFPYVDGPITYTGRVRGEAGNAASFIRVFLK